MNKHILKNVLYITNVFTQNNEARKNNQIQIVSITQTQRQIEINTHTKNQRHEDTKRQPQRHIHK